ncbi:MAG: DUF2283 domain-containing protein [Desulfatiglandales bacterium]|nr:DUF2283 domain-containing protein [Desulfatiglandales bacterium]
MDTSTIDLSFVSNLLRLPSTHVWSDYDDEADVLYLSFEKPQCADDSIMEEDGNVHHYRKNRLVGITLPNAKQRFLNRPGKSNV